MRKEFNQSVFNSLPDSVWQGKMPELHSSARGGRTIRIRVYSVAAAFCLLFVSATMLVLSGNRKETTQERVHSSSGMTYSVNAAVRGDVTLPDGTQVCLNSGSSLRLADDFGSSARTVFLDGEAMFQVARDERLPFFVKTPQDVVVKVTGTKFNVRCYSDQSSFGLTLLQGSVEISSGKESLKVKPSEHIVIESGSSAVTVVDNPQQSVAWTRGVLLFDNSPMDDVFRKIERAYGITILVTDDSVYQGSFTAEFTSESLTNVLDLLCLTSGLTYKVSGNTVTLSPKN